MCSSQLQNTVIGGFQRIRHEHRVATALGGGGGRDVSGLPEERHGGFTGDLDGIGAFVEADRDGLRNRRGLDRAPAELCPAVQVSCHSLVNRRSIV